MNRTIKYFSDIWGETNSIPKWSFCYALMVLTILAVSDKFAVI